MRIILLLIGAFAALLIAGLALALAAARTDAGRHWIADEVSALSAGTILINGLAGAVPGDFAIERLVLSDGNGPYFEGRGIRISTSPLRLLFGVLAIDRLNAREIHLSRMPIGDETRPRNQNGLPARIAVSDFEIDLLDIAEPLAGLAVQLHVTGSGRLDDLHHGQIALEIARGDAPGRYHLDGRIDDRNLAFHAAAQEPAQGFLAHLAGLDSIGPIELSAAGEGPQDDQKFVLSLNAGPARLQAKGKLDLDHKQIAFDATGTAGEGHPRSDLGWRAIQFEAHVHGGFETPEAEGHVVADQIAAGDFAIDSARIQFGGNQGRVALTGRIDGLHLPGRSRNLFAAAPVMIRAEAILNAADRPITLDLEHPLLKAAIKAKTERDVAADLDLALPRLGPLAQIAGVELDGAAKLTAQVVHHRDETRIESQGTLDFAGKTLVSKLLGKSAHFDIAASGIRDLIRFDRARIDGRDLRLEATGRLVGRELDADWKVNLPDLSSLAPELSGALRAAGRMQDSLDHLTLTGDLTGSIARRDMSSGPLKASFRLDDLPNAPSGRIEASGELLSAPLRMAVAANETKTGLRVSIEAAEWKSAHAKGAVDLAKGTEFPTGRIEAAMDDLGDLAPLLGETVSGRLNARFDAERAAVHLRAEGEDVAMAAIRLHRVDLDGHVTDPRGHPKLDGKLRLAGIKGGHVTDGSALLNAQGSLDSLAIRLQSALMTDSGAVKIAGSGTGNIERRALDLALGLDLGTTHAADVKLSGAMPSNPDAPIALACSGHLDLAALDPILTPNGEMARGTLALALHVSGSSAAPRLGGTIALDNGTLQDLAIGFRLSHISAHIDGQGQKLVIRDFTGRGRDGDVHVEGDVGILEAGIPINIHLSAEPAGLLSSDLLTATMSADLAIQGQALEALTLAGKVDVAKADINLPDRMPQQVASLDVRRPGEAPPAEQPGLIRLDLSIAAPERVFLRGQGIDAELGGTLKIAGTSTKPQMTGGFDLRGGTFSIAGQQLKFTRGKITLDVAGSNGQIDPVLDLAAESVSSTITVDLTVTGHADSPKITLTSTPDLPQDEILSQLLFKKSTTQLSPLQIAEIAEALANLAGGSVNPIANIRRGLGLDRLSVGSDSSGGTSLEAGKYVSRGIYVGAKQAAGNSQGQVQVDLTSSLQLQSTLGNGGVPTSATTPDNDPGSSIGLSWHIDY